MKLCNNCNEPIPSRVTLADGRTISTQRRKFCLKCSPYGEHNTKDLSKKAPNPSTKKCPNCGDIKLIHDFYTRRRGSKKEQEPSPYCRICVNKLTVQRHRKLKVNAVAYLGGKCIKCGYAKCMAALEFHHHDASQKDPALIERKLAMTRLTVEKLSSELDKCLLVCANCHRESHLDTNKLVIDILPTAKAGGF